MASRFIHNVTPPRAPGVGDRGRPTLQEAVQAEVSKALQPFATKLAAAVAQAEKDRAVAGGMKVHSRQPSANRFKLPKAED